MLMLTPCLDAPVSKLVAGIAEAEVSGEEQSPTCEGGRPVCRLAQGTDPSNWRAEQEQDVDLVPVLQWMEANWKPKRREVAGCSPASKGLSVGGACEVLEKLGDHPHG